MQLMRICRHGGSAFDYSAYPKQNTKEFKENEKEQDHYSNSTVEDDLELIRKRFAYWKKKV